MTREIFVHRLKTVDWNEQAIQEALWMGDTGKTAAACREIYTHLFDEPKGPIIRKLVFEMGREEAIRRIGP